MDLPASQAKPPDQNSLTGCGYLSPSLHHSIKVYRNINLLSIDYAFQPRLRTRLTQGRRTLPWKPWVSDGKDSHLTYRYSYRHSHFLTLHMSSRSCFYADRNAHLPINIKLNSAVSVPCFSPDTFSAQSHSTSELLRTL